MRRRGLRVELTFTGTKSKLEKALVGLGKTRTSRVMIGTWPTPEKPPRIRPNPGRDVLVQLTFTGTKSRLERALLALGKTRPSPVAIDTVPLPE